MADTRTAQLADLSLEQLREVVVTSVTLQDERLDRVAASAFVIRAEDIRRAGATTLPEALRLAPQLDVARADANQYAISARGFNNTLANKMLVLIDGRTVYTPLFSGVFWDAQNVVLDDIERIEVVSGPGTALWGTNAVNGLIHVVTRSAARTQGVAGSVHAGNRERGGSLRYGGRLGAEGHYRVHALAFDRSHTRREDGSAVRDEAEGVQLGFRTDWSQSRDTLTVEGDVYRSSIDQAPQGRDLGGAHLLARWQRALDADTQTTLQLYWDRTKRRQLPLFEETLDTFDAVAHFGHRAGPRHRLLFGAGARHARDDTSGGPALAILPLQKRLNWWRLFAQDEIDLGGDVGLTLAGSIERNPYTGIEVLPSARIGWQLDERHLLWAALSRAVRAPSRVDREFFQPAAPPFVFAGGPRFDSEVSVVAEAGVRAWPSERLSYALTGFIHRHRRLRSFTPTADGVQFDNNIDGSTDGIEAWLAWHWTPRARVRVGAVELRNRLHVIAGAVDAGGLPTLGNDPHGWASVRLEIDWSDRLRTDAAVRHVRARPVPTVPAYTAVDASVGWRLAGGELALVLSDLLDRRHVEWGAPNNRVEFERSLSVQFRWPL